MKQAFRLAVADYLLPKFPPGYIFNGARPVQACGPARPRACPVDSPSTARLTNPVTPATADWQRGSAAVA